MSNCSCKHVTLYEEGYRCIECFEPFIQEKQLDESNAHLQYIRTEIVSLIQEEFDNYAPDHPPVGVGDFMDALEEVCRD
jgi:hypothetical protein